MQNFITPEDYQTATKQHKYGAKRTEVDGHLFDSKKEARRYQELKLLERMGKITNLTLQPEFPLMVNNIRIGYWKGDFSYFDFETGQEIVEDVKGLKLPFYKWKKKHFEAQYGRKIRET